MDEVAELLLLEPAISKLGRRRIAAAEVGEVRWNDPRFLPNQRSPARGRRRLLVGRTNGGRTLTLVIESTVDPTTWLVVTGWPATGRERRLLRKAR